MPQPPNEPTPPLLTNRNDCCFCMMGSSDSLQQASPSQNYLCFRAASDQSKVCCFKPYPKSADKSKPKLFLSPFWHLLTQAPHSYPQRMGSLGATSHKRNLLRGRRAPEHCADFWAHSSAQNSLSSPKGRAHGLMGDARSRGQNDFRVVTSQIKFNRISNREP